MDDRQRHVVEGAGLQESRLNTEFIDWLRKWGSSMLWVVLIIASSWAGYKWWLTKQSQKMDTAFVQYENAVQAGSPDNLLGVANASKGRGSIFELAKLQAADIYLRAAKRGVRPGGVWDNEDDALSEEDQANDLDRAKRLYSEVLDRVRGHKGMEIQEFSARNGLIAVAITDGDFDAARALIKDATAEMKADHFDELASWLERRSDELDALTELPELYDTDALAAAWRDVGEEDASTDAAPGADAFGPAPPAVFDPAQVDKQPQPQTQTSPEATDDEDADDDGSGFGPAVPDPTDEPADSPPQ